MAYRGTLAIQLPEMESQRRLRESAGVLPDGSGFFTATVKTKKEAAEGGPGSGPQGGRHSKDKTKSVKQAQQAHIDKKVAMGHKLVGRGTFPNGTHYHNLKSPDGRVTQYVTFGPGHGWGGEGAKVVRAQG